MKKMICMLLALLSCCVFSAAVSAENAGANTSASDVATTTVTTTTTTTAPDIFTGTVKMSYDSTPVNTEVVVSVSVEGDTLTESDVIRYRLYDGTVTDADAHPEIEWIDYTEPVVLKENTVIEAAVFSAGGARSASAVETITCIDRTLPTPPQITPSTTEWTKEPVTVTLSGGSDDQSGLRRLEYRVGAEGVWAEYTDTISISSAGTVYARSVDMAGNLSEISVLEINNFDLTAPDVAGMTVALTSGGSSVVADSGTFSKYFGSGVTVSVSGAVDGASGVAGYQYQTVSGTEAVKEDKWQKYDPAEPPVVRGDFCGYVYVRALDKVGNCSAAVASEGFVVDVTPPVIDNIKLSETKMTDSRVVVTFTVTDNYWLETVTVNDVYAGVYISSFTAFQNDDYLIVAYDKVGNRSEKVVEITNINTTPFTLLDTWNGLKAQDFTPSTWTVAEKAAEELHTLITVDAPQAQIDASAGKLLTALEGLVTRGDGTLSRELIERVREFEYWTYTESSWDRMTEGISALEQLLDDPESTQEMVDNGRRSLEQLISELVKVADFTDLDRLISQCERMETDGFSTESYNAFAEALSDAKELSRTDSGQADADAAYQRLLAAMGALEVYEKDKLDLTPVVFVILGLLIVAAATALFIVNMRAKNNHVRDEDLEEIEYDDYDEDEDTADFGDIHFTDEETENVEKEEPEESYIGGRNRKTEDK